LHVFRPGQAADLSLLRAPSVYDFRKQSISTDLPAAGLPSSTVFEMCPNGFLTMLSYLGQREIKVRVVNPAARMTFRKHPRFAPG
jgi:hypothetical protein